MVLRLMMLMVVALLDTGAAAEETWLASGAGPYPIVPVESVEEADPNPNSPAADPASLFHPCLVIGKDRGLVSVAAVGDLNSDGRADVAVSVRNSGAAVGVYLQDSRGHLVFDAEYPGGSGEDIVITDVNGDGRDDVVVPTTNGVGVLTQTADGKLDPQAVVAGTYTAGLLHVADFDGDGRMDIAASRSSHWGTPGDGDLYRQLEIGGLALVSPRYLPDESLVTAAADLSGDGLADIVTTRGGDRLEVQVLRQSASGEFEAEALDYQVHKWGGVLSIAAGDLNSDGKPDLALASSGTRLTLYFQGDDGLFGPSTTTWAGGELRALDVADVNGDGRADLVALDSGHIYVYPQLFAEMGTPERYKVPFDETLSPHIHIQKLAIEDVNNDGAPDIVAAAHPGHGVMVLYHRPFLSPTAATAKKGKSFHYQIIAGNRATFFEADDLPAGLSLNSETGVIAGTPVAAGSYSIAIRCYLGSKVCVGNLKMTVLQPKSREHTGSIANPNPYRFQGTYFGLIHNTSGELAFFRSGVLQVSVTRTGVFTATLRLADTVYPLQGVFVDGVAEVLIKESLALRLELHAGSNGPAVWGWIHSGWRRDATFTGLKRMPAKRSDLHPAGYYTVALGSPIRDLERKVPRVYGRAGLHLSRQGAVRLITRLSDGRVISQGSPLAADGTWPFYINTPNGRGTFTGAIAFGDMDDSDCLGTANWYNRPRVEDTPPYPTLPEVAVELPIVGSRYRRKKPVLDVHNVAGSATISLAAGGLNPLITQTAQMSKDNSIFVNDPNAVQTKLFVNPLTGFVHGSFDHPERKARTSLDGVALQKANVLLGFFHGVYPVDHPSSGWKYSGRFLFEAGSPSSVFSRQNDAP